LLRSPSTPTHNKQTASHLDEANVSGVLPEALTADVQVVLADDTTLVAADLAAKANNKQTAEMSRDNAQRLLHQVTVLSTATETFACIYKLQPRGKLDTR
jgi:hypothetical protein